jgi:hypothetical protein
LTPRLCLSSLTLSHFGVAAVVVTDVGSGADTGAAAAADGEGDDVNHEVKLTEHDGDDGGLAGSSDERVWRVCHMEWVVWVEWKVVSVSMSITAMGRGEERGPCSMSTCTNSPTLA